MIIKRYINKALHLFEIVRIKIPEKKVFLTFDDGPEEGITEFVLGELKKYDAHATFFCRGDYANENMALLDLIKNEGHVIGNHTYSHIKGFDYSCKDYISDIEKANTILNSHLFRPPWGAITLHQFLNLRKKYKIVYWSLASDDTLREEYNHEGALSKLIAQTRSGDVVLFHCCKRHEKETRRLLPPYLKWLSEEKYSMSAIY